MNSKSSERDVFYVAIDTIRLSAKELRRHMLVEEIKKTTAWRDEEKPVNMLTRNFRVATSGTLLKDLCNAYGVAFDATDLEATRRNLCAVMSTGG